MKWFIGGYFDPFHDGHLSHLRQTIRLMHPGDKLICLIGSDDQLLLKKGHLNMHEQARAEIVGLVLKGLGVQSCTVINHWDKGNIIAAKAMEAIKPDVMVRAGDKSDAIFPPEERSVCEKYGIRVIYTVLTHDRHSSWMIYK